MQLIQASIPRVSRRSEQAPQAYCAPARLHCDAGAHGSSRHGEPHQKPDPESGPHESEQDASGEQERRRRQAPVDLLERPRADRRHHFGRSRFDTVHLHSAPFVFAAKAQKPSREAQANVPRSRSLTSKSRSLQPMNPKKVGPRPLGAAKRKQVASRWAGRRRVLLDGRQQSGPALTPRAVSGAPIPPSASATRSRAAGGTRGASRSLTRAKPARAARCQTWRRAHHWNVSLAPSARERRRQASAEARLVAADSPLL